jgi:hypothetical protein
VALSGIQTIIWSEIYEMTKADSEDDDVAEEMDREKFVHPSGRTYPRTPNTQSTTASRATKSPPPQEGKQSLENEPLKQAWGKRRSEWNSITANKTAVHSKPIPSVT